MISLVHTLPSTLIANILTTIDINGIATPFNLSLQSLQRFCRPVMFHKDDTIYNLAYSGSSLLFRYRGHNLLMCCKHQLIRGALKAEDICLLIEEAGGKVALTPDATTMLSVETYEDKTPEDILFVEYLSDRGGREIQRNFLHIDLEKVAMLDDIPPDKIVLIFAIGYPERFSDYETNFDATGEAVSLDITSRWVKLYLEMRERLAWDLETRIPLQVHEKYHADIGNPAGFSGSPVFFIWQDNARQTHLGLAGMITHGNETGSFQVYPAKSIKRIIAEIINGKPI